MAKVSRKQRRWLRVSLLNMPPRIPQDQSSRLLTDQSQVVIPAIDVHVMRDELREV